MALGFNKNRDVWEIFNDKYKANHNEEFFKKEKAKQDSFNARMYGTKSVAIPSNNKTNPTNINDRIKNMNEIQQKDNINNFKNNLK